MISLHSVIIRTSKWSLYLLGSILPSSTLYGIKAFYGIYINSVIYKTFSLFRLSSSVLVKKSCINFSLCLHLGYDDYPL